MITTKTKNILNKPKLHESLKIKRKLPQIIIPKNKINMFLEWYNEDLRFQNTIPKAFEEGYLIIDNEFINLDIDNCNSYIKSLAKQLNYTYRQVEQRLKYLLEELEKVTLYFKFVDNNVYAYLYGKDNTIVSSISFEFGEGESEFIDEFQITKLNDWDELLNQFNTYCVVLLASSMWYISTSTKKTSYYYEEKHPIMKSKDKEIKKVKSHKTISTPIYDMQKIRKVKVEHLVKRRKGWTYSHAFQVHGHYRHYKDGKVVFVNSYIKGENKPLQNQIITLDPK